MVCRMISFMLVFCSSVCFAQGKEFPHLEGSYLGQKPPGMNPEIFAPGFVSTEHRDHSDILFMLGSGEVRGLFVINQKAGFWSHVWRGNFLGSDRGCIQSPIKIEPVCGSRME